MGDRLKQLRRALGLSQDEFARRLGLTRGAITNIELDKVPPKPLLIDLICDVFGAQKEWLLTGEGEMLKPRSRDDQIMDFVASAMSGESDNFRRRLLSVLARLDEDQWGLLERYVRELAGTRPDDPGSDKEGEG